jgi:hypothetical protein
MATITSKFAIGRCWSAAYGRKQTSSFYFVSGKAVTNGGSFAFLDLDDVARVGNTLLQRVLSNQRAGERAGVGEALAPTGHNSQPRTTGVKFCEGTTLPRQR